MLRVSTTGFAIIVSKYLNVPFFSHFLSFMQNASA